MNATNVFNFIKENIGILDVVQQYTNVKKAGLYWKGNCPFHHEKTPSFTVSPHKGIFYCFGCSMGGDVVYFIEKAENRTPFEAVQYLAERHNITIPDSLLKSSPHQSETTESKKQYWKACTVFAQWCHLKLKKSKEALHYVQTRNISNEIIDHFQLGYFPSSPKQLTSLLTFAKQQSILAHDLIEAHIMFKGRATLYSPFEERIIFPITDHLGRFCGFGGRTFLPTDTRAKYYNSKETPLFAKGSLLYGFSQAKKAIHQQETSFLVEGYTDCLAMVQHGYENTVATLGTACTGTHLQQLSRYCQTLSILYDGDQAGHNAVMRLAELCWHMNLDPEILSLPKGSDPASYLDTHKSLDALVKEKQDIFSFFVQSLGHDFNKKPLAHKVQVTKKLLTVIRGIDEPIKQNILLEKTAKMLDIPFMSLLKSLQSTSSTPEKLQSIQQPAKQELKRPEASDLKTISRLEKKIFSVIINNMELIAYDEVVGLIDYFSHSLQNILKKVHALSKQGAVTFNTLYNELDEEQRKIISQILLEFNDGKSKEEFDYLLKLFQKHLWKCQVNNIKLQIDQAQKNNNIQEVSKLLDKFQLLKKKLITD